MKKSLILLVVAIFALGSTSFAQRSIKLGHLNSTELMQIMPGKDSAQAAFQAEVDALEAQLTAMQTEFQNKYNEFMEKQSQMTELIRRTKEQELMDMRQRIESFSQNAQQQLQEREKALLQPIIDRAKQAIAEVAKENGYTYIFDISAGALLYQQDSDDILPLVKKKLGLK